MAFLGFFYHRFFHDFLCIDVVIELANESVLSELWYVDDLVLMSETINEHEISSENVRRLLIAS